MNDDGSITVDLVALREVAGDLEDIVKRLNERPASSTRSSAPTWASDRTLRRRWPAICGRPGAPGPGPSPSRPLRVYAANPPVRLRQRLGEYYRLPDVGLPPEEIRDWLTGLADRLDESLANGQAPPPAAPTTPWEWRARFPELAQLLGGWFSQDMPDEFGDHEAALADYLEGTDTGLVAQLTGELHDLLALGLDEDGLAMALVTLGAEVEPPVPFTPGAWLASLAVRLRR
ncbi:contact-dependent growth inhibition system immunity protein [Streptomyces sp. NPDC046324]|uniref:contact-dependent growth inhibition system immunity protein n=1 Tax=Streptomyces sp. NPDC046324 TaxID=3154915 RepID=UPI0033E3A14B